MFKPVWAESEFRKCIWDKYFLIFGCVTEGGLFALRVGGVYSPDGRLINSDLSPPLLPMLNASFVARHAES